MKKLGIICASDTELSPFLKQIKTLQTFQKAMLSLAI